jgi:predicted nucleotidyltransferase
MPNESLRLPLEEAVRLFQRHGVEFLVIGGQAESLMGSPRVTIDVDLCYRRTEENVRRLAEALSEIRPRLRNAPPDLPFQPDARTLTAGLNFTLATDIGDLDLLGEVEPIGAFDMLNKSAEIFESGGLTIRTISLNDLIRVKQHIKRFKDSESLFQLLAIRKAREQTGLR